MAGVRHKIEPRDVPPCKAARRLHLTLDDFREKLPELKSRGFPDPDPTTGNYFLADIDCWMENRTKRLSTGATVADDDPEEAKRRIERL